jgi:hypothetical protein
MGPGAPGASSGPSTGLVELEANSRHARERYRLYKAKAYGPRPTSPEHLRRLERESELAGRRLQRARTGARHAKT